MFGHTHKPYLETKDGVTILNPGSLSYPRQEGRRPSYMIMDIDEAGEAITPRSIFKKLSGGGKTALLPGGKC